MLNWSVGSANEGEVGDMPKDLWRRLVDTHDMDHTYISGAIS